MNDDKLVVSPEEANRLMVLQPGSGDVQFAQTFAAIAQAIELCEHGEHVALLLSTCRNEYLTVNAVFANLKMCVGGQSGSLSHFGQLISSIEHATLTQPPAETARRSLDRLLSHAQEKLKVWDDRESLWAEYEKAAAQVSDFIGQGLAKSVLTHASAIPHDDGYWPATYTRMSKDETKFHDKLKLLAEITANLSAVHEFLTDIAAMQTTRVLDVAQPSADVPVVSTPVVWEAVITSASNKTAWHVSQGAAGGVKLIHKNLPGADQGWDDNVVGKSVELMSETAPGDDTKRQVVDALRFAEIGVDYARFLLRREFAANAARLPMPPPFLIDLTPREPTARSQTAPREFRRNLTQVAEGDNRVDKTKIALLRVAIPEGWHNRERNYRYDTDMADIDAITTLIKDAIQAAAEAGAKFLFLPECFIPRTAVQAVKKAAARAHINLIGGVETRIDGGGKTVNEALIWFPHQSPDTDNVSGLELFQRKQGPSVFETHRDNFASDGRLNVIKNTLLGNVGVVVCSDFLEADLIASLNVTEAPRLHALVVIARNPRPLVFTTLAQADAIRLYSHVIVVNSTDGEDTQLKPSADDGCIVAVPKDPYLLKEHQRQALHALPKTSDGVQSAELLIWELDVAGIHARTNRGAQRGWLKPSVYAQQA